MSHKERPPAAVPEALRLLADETRWRLVNELRWSDRQVSDLCGRIGLPQNLISYHLGLLRQSGLIQSHRSDADGRALYYGLNLTGLHAGLDGINRALYLDDHPATRLAAIGPILFVCTRNSARSQMAEGWLRHLSESRVIARSAGTTPASVHPLAVQAMSEVGIDIGHQYAKSLDTIVDLAPQTVVTVCDLAREQCEFQPPAPLQLHWSIPDPVSAHYEKGDPITAFRAARDELGHRVAGLLSLLSIANSSRPGSDG